MDLYMNRLTKLFCGTLLSLVIVPQAVTAGQAEIIFEDSFETTEVGSPPNPETYRIGRLNAWGSCSGNCAEIRDERSRYGNKSMMSYLHRQDSPVRYRTEAVPRGPARSPDILTHYWYGFSIFIPDSHQPDYLAGDIVAQWHGEGGRNPPIALSLKGDKVVFKVRWDANGSQQGTAYDLGPYVKGVWTDYVMHNYSSTGSDGITELWINGNRVVNHRGPNNFDSPDGIWPKFGLYRTQWRNGEEYADIRYDADIYSRTFYHDEIRIAEGLDGGYELVAPPGSAPVEPEPEPTPSTPPVPQNITLRPEG